MRFFKILMATLALVFASQTVFAAPAVNTLEKKLFSFKPNGIAIRGYDTVAYFTQSQPVEGKDEFTTQWQDATWKFSSQEHLDLFLAEPEKYAPQYGGYCAFGVAGGYLVKIEPDQWSIIDDKLYLNYSADVSRQWKEDIPGFIKIADTKFDELLAKE